MATGDIPEFEICQAVLLLLGYDLGLPPNLLDGCGRNGGFTPHGREVD
jgi:hypothetical protein